MNITFLGIDNEITFSSEQEILHLCLRSIVFYKVSYTISRDLNWDNIQSNTFLVLNVPIKLNSNLHIELYWISDYLCSTKK